jgi:hypothetical protein
MNFINGFKIMFFVGLLTFVFTGCAQSGYQEFYSQQSPKKYPKTEKVMLFEYSNIKLRDIKTILFDDYLVIGQSGFNGPYENPENAISFAKSIGADIVITNAQFKETRSSIVPLTLPSTTTTNFSGYSGGSSFYGSATSYGTQTTMMPITVHRYHQDGIFLKNINNVHPLWERTTNDYKKTTDNSLEGIWENESYKIKIFQSGTQITSFITEVKKDINQSFWQINDLKFIFGNETNKGIYLMGDKTPIPSIFTLNKFGFLEVELITSGQKISFARVQ